MTTKTEKAGGGRTPPERADDREDPGIQENEREVLDSKNQKREADEEKKIAVDEGRQNQWRTPGKAEGD